jgi:hypothetical protein
MLWPEKTLKKLEINNKVVLNVLIWKNNKKVNYKFKIICMQITGA